MKLNKVTKSLLISLSVITCISIMGITGIGINNILEAIKSNQESLENKFDNLKNQINDDKYNKEVANIDEKNSNKNIIKEYSNEELRKLNIFLSNFSEVYFNNFSRDNYDEKQLIKFGIMHLLVNDYDKAMNNDNSIQDSNGNSRAYTYASDVQDTIEKYFGFTVENQSIEHFKYIDGKYIQPLASGEIFPNFTQVNEIYSEGDTLRVIGNIYSPQEFNDTANNDWRYDPMDTDSSLIKELNDEGNVEAIVRLVNDNGKLMYKLLDYKVSSEKVKR